MTERLCVCRYFRLGHRFCPRPAPGDEFSVLYETQYVDGEFVAGRILAEFANRGDKFGAILHDNGNYYTPNGRAMRKTFQLTGEVHLCEF